MFGAPSVTYKHARTCCNCETRCRICVFHAIVNGRNALFKSVRGKHRQNFQKTRDRNRKPIGFPIVCRRGLEYWKKKRIRAAALNSDGVIRREEFIDTECREMRIETRSSLRATFESLDNTLSHVILRIANVRYVSGGSHTAQGLLCTLPYDCIFIARRRTVKRDALTL